MAACGSASTDDASTGDASTTAAAESTTTTTEAPTTTTTIDPGTLPQTEDRPTASGAQWDAHTAALWSAIVTDDPSKAMPFFFPLAAYRQVKAISDPKGDWDSRLIKAYEEDIHALHKQLGADAERAQFVKIDVPAGNTLWIKPGVEYNKGAYWRVLDSKLTYTIGSSTGGSVPSAAGTSSPTTAKAASTGTTRTMTIKSMISWRGEWYIVHLTAIR